MILRDLTPIEAYRYYLEGYPISSGGYTFMYNVGSETHYYFAYGTYPGCLRGSGECDIRTTDPFNKMTWSAYTNARQLIEEMGFLTEVICSPWMLDFITKSKLSVLDMNEYIIDSEYKYADFADPEKSAEIWQKYFADLDNKKDES